MLAKLSDSAPHMAPDLEIKQKTITSAQQLALETADGKLHVLCVGISDYTTGSGFAKLPVCTNDAVKVAHCFQDVRELNADKAKIRTLTSKNGSPSKGAIIQAMHELACGANESDRILFFFSGHGQRLDDDDEFYLVPEDAFRADDRDTLLSLFSNC